MIRKEKMTGVDASHEVTPGQEQLNMVYSVSIMKSGEGGPFDQKG